MQSSVLSSSDVDIIAITLVVVVLVACLVACGSYWQELLLQETRSFKILSKRLPPSPTITQRPEVAGAKLPNFGPSAGEQLKTLKLSAAHLRASRHSGPIHGCALRTSSVNLRL